MECLRGEKLTNLNKDVSVSFLKLVVNPSLEDVFHLKMKADPCIVVTNNHRCFDVLVDSPIKPFYGVFTSSASDVVVNQNNYLILDGTIEDPELGTYSLSEVKRGSDILPKLRISDLIGSIGIYGDLPLFLVLPQWYRSIENVEGLLEDPDFKLVHRLEISFSEFDQSSKEFARIRKRLNAMAFDLISVLDEKIESTKLTYSLNFDKKSESNVARIIKNFEESISKIDKKMELVEKRFTSEISALNDEVEKILDRSNQKFSHLSDNVNSKYTDITSGLAEVTRNIDEGFDEILANVRTKSGGVIYHINKSRSDMLTSIKMTDRRLYNQLEAFYSLRKDVEFNIPPLRGWAMAPDALYYLHQAVVKEKPNVIIEFGSGVSTLILANALRKNGQDGSSLVSIEHRKESYVNTLSLLKENGLSQYVKLVLAPLVVTEYSSPRNTGDQYWYNIPPGTVDVVDFAIIDGPPESTCTDARYPALHYLRDKLSAKSTIFIDDASRESETFLYGKFAEVMNAEVKFHRFDKGLAEISLVRINSEFSNRKADCE